MAANLSFLKRLVKEDFPKQYQDLVDRIGYILNPALQQIVSILNHGLLISDLNTQVKDLTITVDANGTPTNSATFTSILNGSCGMMQVGRAQCTASSTTYPTGAVFVSFTQQGTALTIVNVTGLPANTQFTLRIIAYV